MGHVLTTAGQIVTDASLALENQKIRRAELELENKRLEELVKANTLTPTVPGVSGAAGRAHWKGCGAVSV